MKNSHRLHFNQQAPDLELLNTAGKTVLLSSLWKKRPLILAFTRHFGCTQCKEMLDELMEGKNRIEEAGLGIVVVTQGSPGATDLFMKQYAPDLLALCDPERMAYHAYGLERGTIFQTVLHPQVIRSVKESGKKGYKLEQPPEGQDAMQMSGTFIINQKGRVLLPFYYDNIADHPALDLLLKGVLSTQWDEDFEGPIGPGVD
jgi:peroxiredoxin